VVGLANSWTIFDDLADQRCPDDLLQGRAQIRAALADCEHWIDRRIKWLSKASWMTGAASVSSLGIAAITDLSDGPALATTAFFAGAFILLRRAPLLVQTRFLDWSSRPPLNDPKLRPLRDYLDRASGMLEPLHDQDGNAVEKEFLQNPWAVLLFSEREEIRQLPTRGSKGRIRVRYPKWLTVSRSSPQVLSEAPAHGTPPAPTDPDHGNADIDQREKVSPVAASPLANASEPTGSSSSKERWPCAFDDTDFEIRLRIFKDTEFVKVKPAIKPHLVKKYVIAIEQARTIWMLTPSAHISAVAEEVGTLVAKGTNGYSGLTNKQSVDWIRPLIAGTGKYKHLKEVFAEISYDPAEYGDGQYRLLF
jgi:hypothetical protein